MSDRNERIRAAFHDDPNAPEWNRDGVLSGVLHHTRELRRQRFFRRAGVWLVMAVVLVLAWMQLRAVPVVPPSPATFDSISTNPAEAAVTIQDNPGSATTITVHEAPPNLMPLLGHRSSLSIDLQNQISKREEYRAAMSANPSREQASELRATIAGIDADIAATRNALRLVDQQLAGLQGGEAMPVTTHEAITYAESPPVIIRSPLPGEPFMWAAGISTAALLIVFVALAYFRKTMRSAIDALSSLQNQASSQMSALTSGIEAIAIEVERLGENQRFMSKVIVGDKEASA